MLRAIAARSLCAALLVGSAVLACDPDLGRSAGSLTVQIVRFPAPADDMRVVVRSGPQSYVLEVPTAGFGGAVAVDSVPIGTSRVEVNALAAGAVLVTKTGTVVVDARRVSTIVFDLASTAPTPGGGPGSAGADMGLGAGTGMDAASSSGPGPSGSGGPGGGSGRGGDDSRDAGTQDASHERGGE